MVIVGIILFSVGAVIIAVYVEGSFAGLLGTLLVSMGTGIMITSSDADRPSAIDVYRGKTTLE